MSNKKLVKLVELLSHFGEVEVKGTYTTPNDLVNIVNYMYIIFTRNDYHFEMKIENTNDQIFQVHFDYMIFKGEDNDDGLLNLTKSIISFIDDLDKIKIDKKVIWSILIKHMKDYHSFPAINVIFDLCNDFIYQIPELEEEEDLQKEFVELYDSKMCKE